MHARFTNQSCRDTQQGAGYSSRLPPAEKDTIAARHAIFRHCFDAVRDMRENGVELPPFSTPFSLRAAEPGAHTARRCQRSRIMPQATNKRSKCARQRQRNVHTATEPQNKDRYDALPDMLPVDIQLSAAQNV